MSITILVPGIPAPQGSKKHIGGGRMVESSKKLPAWRRAVKIAAATTHQGAEPLDQPLAVDIIFYLPKPKRPRFPLPATTPDLDKLCRSTLDGLEQSGMIRNDSRVVTLRAAKTFHQDGFTGAHITIQGENQ
ncbi:MULTISPECIES: RusA family crossover junction endodeoxyribonuclease [Corynebacterium]|uniref:RusA family crossover junction endodeoxyribonuclease n=1 Tax=Corynebacterium TaxID=1716 RepID=UPI00124C15E7|nr:MULTISPECIES: RusA family crossover junction endodeoxyribonuclease [Corynebacterium]